MIEVEDGRVSCRPTVRSYICTHLKCLDIVGSVNQVQITCAGASTVRFHRGFVERGWQVLHGFGLCILKLMFQISIE